MGYSENKTSNIEKQTKLIILNGPAGSGKDEVVKQLRGQLDFKHVEFKSKLRELTADLFGVDRGDAYNHFEDRELKGTPCSLFKIQPVRAIELMATCYEDKDEAYERLIEICESDGMLTPREALIWTSEHVIKPQMGQDYFGKQLANSCRQGLNITSDGGFESEAKACVGRFGVDNVIVIQIRRDGYSFEGDSRNYISDDICSKSYRVNNNGTIPELINEVSHIINKFINKPNEDI